MVSEVSYSFLNIVFSNLSIFRIRSFFVLVKQSDKNKPQTTIYFLTFFSPDLHGCFYFLLWLVWRVGGWAFHGLHTGFFSVVADFLRRLSSILIPCLLYNVLLYVRLSHIPSIILSPIDRLVFGYKTSRFMCTNPIHSSLSSRLLPFCSHVCFTFSRRTFWFPRIQKPNLTLHTTRNDKGFISQGFFFFHFFLFPFLFSVVLSFFKKISKLLLLLIKVVHRPLVYLSSPGTILSTSGSSTPHTPESKVILFI